MNQTQIDALIARLRKLIPARGEWTTLAHSACGDAADALELLSASKPAAPEGWEPELLCEPCHNVCYTQDMVPRDERIDVVVISHADYERLLTAFPAAPSADTQDERGAVANAVHKLKAALRTDNQRARKFLIEEAIEMLGAPASTGEQA